MNKDTYIYLVSLYFLISGVLIEKKIVYKIFIFMQVISNRIELGISYSSVFP